MAERTAIGLRYGLFWGGVTVVTWWVLVYMTKYFIPTWQPQGDWLVSWIVPTLLFLLVAVPTGIYRALNPW